MHPKNRNKLAGRVIKAAEVALAARKFVSSIDVLVGMGWLDSQAVQRWRLGQVDYLERVVQANLARISKAMKVFRSWATERALIPRETHYKRRSQTLRFSKSGHPSLERMYRTHWVSPQLIHAKHASEKTDGRPSELRSPHEPADRREAPLDGEMRESSSPDFAGAP
jgi:hypothetical protein